MKRLLLLSAIVLLAAFSAGCNNTNSNPSSSPQGTESEIAGNEQAANSSSGTSYFKNEQPDSISNDKDQLIWTSGAITITANKEAVNSPEGSVIKKITLQSEDHSADISLNQDFSAIDAISISPGGDFAAVSLSSGGYSSLLILRADTGEQVDINEKLQKSGVDNLESIESFNWSPDGKAVAFSYGGPGQFRIGSYSINDDRITSLADEATYISVANVLWDTQGNMLDYAAEEPSDQWKLYRYNLQEQSVQEVRNLSRDELSNFEEYSPKYIGG